MKSFEQINEELNKKYLENDKLIVALTSQQLAMLNKVKSFNEYLMVDGNRFNIEVRLSKKSNGDPRLNFRLMKENNVMYSFDDNIVINGSDVGQGKEFLEKMEDLIVSLVMNEMVDIDSSNKLNQLVNTLRSKKKI